MYRHGQQVLRLAGLHLGEDSSGKHKGKVSITKAKVGRVFEVLVSSSVAFGCE